MARRQGRTQPATEDAVTAEQTETPSVEARKGKRGHDDQGNVRPADGRYGLHEPKDESKYVRSGIGDDSAEARVK